VLAYYDTVRRDRLPAALVQGLRDFFGAHMYRRVDREGVFHAVVGGSHRARGLSGHSSSAVQGVPGLLPSRWETTTIAAKSSVAQLARTMIG
jgi:hypothetical protein